MSKKYEISPIGYIYNDYIEKFGIPRQSGLSENMISKIVFEKKYKDLNYLKGIEEFSHLWLIWHFSEVDKNQIKPTVRPPKLGGNKKVGVFATRSPFRPNQLGLSCVKLIKTEITPKEGKVLFVIGADLMNGTPIFDIKPYLPYTDIRNDATNGFADTNVTGLLDIKCDDALLSKIDQEKIDSLFETLRQDPRPSYQDDPTRIYGMSYGDSQIKFKINNDELEIIDVI